MSGQHTADSVWGTLGICGKSLVSCWYCCFFPDIVVLAASIVLWLLRTRCELGPAATRTQGTWTCDPQYVFYCFCWCFTCSSTAASSDEHAGGSNTRRLVFNQITGPATERLSPLNRVCVRVPSMAARRIGGSYVDGGDRGGHCGGVLELEAVDEQAAADAGAAGGGSERRAPGGWHRVPCGALTRFSLGWFTLSFSLGWKLRLGCGCG